MAVGNYVNRGILQITQLGRHAEPALSQHLPTLCNHLRLDFRNLGRDCDFQREVFPAPEIAQRSRECLNLLTLNQHLDLLQRLSSDNQSRYQVSSLCSVSLSHS